MKQPHICLDETLGVRYAVFVEQNGHILRHDADHHRAEADVVQRFMRLPAVEDHLGVDLSAAPQRDGLPVLDLKGGHNALKPGHFRLDIGQKREARLIAVRAVCHQLERLRPAAISMYPKLFEASGIPYGELLDDLIALALEA